MCVSLCVCVYIHRLTRPASRGARLPGAGEEESVWRKREDGGGTGGKGDGVEEEIAAAPKHKRSAQARKKTKKQKKTWLAEGAIFVFLK
jgi:hypothetical protein